MTRNIINGMLFGALFALVCGLIGGAPAVVGVGIVFVPVGALVGILRTISPVQDDENLVA